MTGDVDDFDTILEALTKRCKVCHFVLVIDALSRIAHICNLLGTIIDWLADFLIRWMVDAEDSWVGEKKRQINGLLF